VCGVVFIETLILGNVGNFRKSKGSRPWISAAGFFGKSKHLHFKQYVYDDLIADPARNS